MIPLTAVSVSNRETNPWLASVYAGVLTAIAAFATILLFRAEIPVLYILAFLLIGAGPVLGYQIATGQLGSNWKPLIGGILGFILLILGFILWPILVGALSKEHAIGKLFLGSLIGIILGIVVFLIVASAMGQDPAWLGYGFTLLWAVWGGSCGAIMTAWRQPVP